MQLLLPITASLNNTISSRSCFPLIVNLWPFPPFVNTSYFIIPRMWPWLTLFKVVLSHKTSLKLPEIVRTQTKGTVPNIALTKDDNFWGEWMQLMDKFSKRGFKYKEWGNNLSRKIHQTENRINRQRNVVKIRQKCKTLEFKQWCWPLNQDSFAQCHQ